MALKFLLIGDEPKNRRILTAGLPAGWQPRTATSRSGVGALIERHAFQVACVDTRMRDDDAGAIIALLRRRVPRLPIVALLAAQERRLVAELRGLNVQAQVTVPFTMEMLRAVLERNALSEPVGEIVRPVPAPAAASTSVSSQFVATDAAARRMLEVALRAAPSNVAVLILGETGTGKNLLAQAIHEQSPLRGKPFVTVSCPSLSRELLESDLFGHVRGAFTGAVQDTWGKVAAAEGGTLFLDEIGDLPPSLQPKLLRVLQEKQYERVGETVPRNANVRIVAATNRDLKAEVAAGRFREDLYYRLNVIALEVPPLRSRQSDIMAAAQLFLDGICKQLGKPSPAFTPEVRRLLERYPWPGNLRELRNMVERAAVLSDSATLDVDDFPTLLAQPSAPQYQVGARVSLEAIETAHIQMVVAKSATLEEAARILQIDKSTLYRKRKAMDDRVAHFVAPAETSAAVGS